MGDAVRALTITQPWAGLIAGGIKLVENRSRSIIKREHVGKRFAIHAGRQIDESVYARIFEIAPELDVDGFSPPWFLASRRCSAVIAVATLDRVVLEWHDGSIVDAHGMDGGPVVELGDQRRWFFGPFGYVLRDVVPLISGVPCRGKLGFWTLPAEVERAVLEQLS